MLFACSCSISFRDGTVDNMFAFKPRKTGWCGSVSEHKHAFLHAESHLSNVMLNGLSNVHKTRKSSDSIGIVQ